MGFGGGTRFLNSLVLLFKVRLDLIENENLCSVASKRRKFRQYVNIGKDTTKAVPFIIIPMNEGEHPIEVLGSVRDSSLTDGIMKKLRVVVRETHTSDLFSYCTKIVKVQ